MIQNHTILLWFGLLSVWVCTARVGYANTAQVSSTSGTWIRSDQADTIQDNTVFLIGYSNTAEFHGLLEFDLTGVDGQVVDAALQLSKSWSGGSAAGESTIEVLPLLTSFNGYRVAERATWNNRSTSPAQPWQTPGADGVGFDRGDTVLASFTASESGTPAGPFTVVGDAALRVLVQENLGGVLRVLVRVSGDYASNGKQFWGLAGPYNGTEASRPVLTVQTAESQSILVAPAELSVEENGGTASFDVTLSSPPSTDVTLRVDSEDVAEITAAPQSLFFTAANWNVPQTVTVTGVNDNSLLGAAVSAVRVSYDAGDAGFATATPGTVQVAIVDDESSVDQTIYVDAAAAGGGNGSQANPYNTFAAGLAAAQGLPQRVKVSLAAGMYRQGGASLMNRSVLTIVEGAADGGTIISGSELWTGWTADGANYYKTWTPNWGLESVRPEATVSDEGRRSEMIFVNGVLMRQVASLGALTSRTHFGSYYVDEAADRIYLRPPSGIDPNSAQVEVAVQRNLVNFYQNNNLVLRNLVFQHSAAADHSSWPNTFAVAIAGGNDGDPLVNPNPDGPSYTRELLIDNCTFRWNNSEGLQANLVQDYVIRNTRFIHNGKGGQLLCSYQGGCDDKGNWALPFIPVTCKGKGEKYPSFWRARRAFAQDLNSSDRVFYQQGMNVVPGENTEILVDRVLPYFNRTETTYSSHFQTPPEAETDAFTAVIAGERFVYFTDPIFREVRQSGNIAVTDVWRRVMRRLYGPPAVGDGLSSRIQVYPLKKGNDLLVTLLHYIPVRKALDIDVIDEASTFAGQKMSVQKKVSTVINASTEEPLKRIDDKTFALPAESGRLLLKIPGWFD